jgi:integrase
MTRRSSRSRTQFLRLRNRIWYVSVPVPRSLRKHFGDVRLVRSLKTDSLAEANERKWIVIAELKAKIVTARRTVRGLPPSLREEAKRLREALIEAPNDETLLMAIDTRLEAIEDKRGEAAAIEVAQLAYGAATLEEAAAPWLAAASRESTRSARRSILDAFAATLGRGLDQIMVEKIGRPEALAVVQKWEAEGLASSTISNRVAVMSSLWSALLSRDVVQVNPWKGVKPLRKNHRGRRAQKRPFTIAEAIATITPRVDSPAGLRDCALFALAFLTGARAGELTSVQSIEETAGATWFSVASENAKTQSSVRRIPVVDGAGRALLRAWSTMEKLPAQSQSSRCSAHLRALGLAGLDQHSCRRTFINLGERAGADPLALMRLVGHKPQGMSFTTYSRSGSDEALIGVAKVVSEAYGSEFSTALAELARRLRNDASPHGAR